MDPEEQSDLGPHGLLQRRFKLTSRQYLTGEELRYYTVCMDESQELIFSLYIVLEIKAFYCY